LPAFPAELSVPIPNISSTMPSLAACAAILLAACPSVSSARRGRGRTFQTLSAEMQPQVVAHTLVRVENEWRAEARAAADCDGPGAANGSGCGGATKSFEQSCGTVVNAVLQASGGDRGVVQEYLDDICGQEVLKGWRNRVCQTFSFAVSSAMTADVYENREDVDVPAVCHEFWKGLAEDEKAIVDKERAASEAHEKQAEEAAAKAAQEAAAEAAKAAARKAEEAAAEAKRRKSEVAAKQAQAKEAAAEAQARKSKEAANQSEVEQRSAEKVAEEADRRQQEVDETLAEAREAIQETEHLQAQTNATDAELALHQMTRVLGSNGTDTEQARPTNATAKKP